MQLRSRRPPPPPGLPDFQKRQTEWSSTPTIAERIPGAGRFALDFKLRDPTGVRAPTPFRQSYEPHMRAFFDQRCPLHECKDGGFSLGATVLDMLSNPRVARSATAVCAGDRPRGGKKQACALEITYTLVELEDA